MELTQAMLDAATQKLSDESVSPKVAKKVIDNLAARGLDVEMFNRVLYKLECMIGETAIRENLNKSTDEEINTAIDSMISDSMEGYYSEIVLSEEGFDENKEYELITTAKQTDHRYGDFEYSKEDLELMAKNFNDNIVGTEIPVDLNHDPEHIAYAWIKPGSMTVKESSQLAGHYSLYGQLYKMTPKGKELITTGAVRYFSLQIQTQFAKFVDKVKKTYKLVIRAMALTNMPVIKDMAPTLSENDKSPLFPNHSQMELTEKEKLLTQQLSEKDTEMKRLSDENAAMKQAQRDIKLSEDVESLCLSNDKKIGFKGGEKAKILEFVKTLSDEQAAAYVALHSDIMTSVSLDESGTGDTPPEAEKTPADADTDPNVEAETKAVELAEKEKIPFLKAYDRVLAEDKKLAKRVEESQGF